TPPVPTNPTSHPARSMIRASAADGGCSTDSTRPRRRISALSRVVARVRAVRAATAGGIPVSNGGGGEAVSETGGAAMGDLPKGVFPLAEGCTLRDFAGATQVFAWAGFTPVWAAKTGDPVKTTEEVKVLPAATFDTVRDEPVEILFVPGGGGKVGDVMLDPD